MAYPRPDLLRPEENDSEQDMGSSLMGKFFCGQDLNKALGLPEFVKSDKVKNSISSNNLKRGERPNENIQTE